MSHSVLSLVVLATTNFFGMFLTGCVGYGGNITFQLGWYLMSLVHTSSGSVLEATTILTVISLPLYIVQITQVWRLANVGLSIVFAVTSVAEMLGPYILAEHDNVWLRRLLGAVFLAVFLYRTLVNQQSQDPPKGAYNIFTCRNLSAAIVVGLMSGILGGLFSCPSPPTMVFCLVAKIGKDEWRGTGTAYSLLELPLRLFSIIYFDRAKLDFGWLWKECLVSFCCGLVGLSLGNVVSKYLSDANFHQIILMLLLYGGLVLVSAGTGTLTLELLFVVSMMMITSLVSRTIWRRRQGVRSQELQIDLAAQQELQIDLAADHKNSRFDLEANKDSLSDISSASTDCPLTPSSVHVDGKTHLRDSIQGA